MGQYYIPVNLSKRQYIDPHKFGDGLKLLEFGASGSGTMCGLAILLADGNNRGGGDLRSEHPIIGTWAGDDVVIAGDYADPKRFTPQNAPDDATLYNYARQHYEDISAAVIEAMCDDSYLRSDLAQGTEWKYRTPEEMAEAPPALRAAIEEYRKAKAEEERKPKKKAAA